MVDDVDDDLIEIYAGPARVVRVTSNVKKDFDAWMEVRGHSQAQFKKRLEKYGLEGEKPLIAIKYIKFEESMQVAGLTKKVKVYVFRGHQMRIYGEPTTFSDGMPGYIGVEIDQKKNNKADRALLQKTANQLYKRHQKLK